jgi:probable phosphoglycerate mutase
MELLLIRHGLPDRVEGIEGPADPPLSELGRRQADALAAWLADEVIDAVYTSPLRRARETATPLAAAASLATRVHDGIAEFDRGFDFYIPMEELKAENHPHWQTLSSGDWAAIPDLDPWRARVVDALGEIAAENRSCRVAVSCHGGVINAFAADVLGITSPLFFEPRYTSVSRFLVSSTGPRSLVSLNECGHLRGLD